MLRLEAAAAEPGMLQVVLMGLITVFLALICLIGIIKLLGLVVGRLPGRKAAAPSPAAAAAPKAAPADKGRLVAAIAAAIAEDMGTDVDHIRIHSIRKI